MNNIIKVAKQYPDLSMVQIVILLAIEKRSKQSITGLARTVKVDHHVALYAINKLINYRLIISEVDPGDHRCKMIFLDVDGIKLGLVEGAVLGDDDGVDDGIKLGRAEGAVLGDDEGLDDGAELGLAEGTVLGDDDGEEDG